MSSFLRPLITCIGRHGALTPHGIFIPLVTMAGSIVHTLELLFPVHYRKILPINGEKWHNIQTTYEKILQAK